MFRSVLLSVPILCAFQNSSVNGVPFRDYDCVKGVVRRSQLFFTSRVAARSSKAFRWFPCWGDVFLGNFRWFPCWGDDFLFF